jgi:uncharacterized OB-fold protein
MSLQPAPGPAADEDSAPFWSALREHRLVLQKCRDCGEVRFPRMPGCPKCGSSASEDVSASGTGRIYSWIVVHRPLGTIPEDALPCTIATVELDEGCRVLGRLVSGSAGIDLPVSARFVDHDEWTELTFAGEPA